MRKVDTVLESGVEQLRQVLGTHLAGEKPAFIGNPSTGDIFVSGTSDTEIYTHSFGSESGGTNIISASGIPKNKIIYGQPILIKKTPGGQYRYVGIDVQADEIYSQGVSETSTQDPVYINQIRWGTMHPVSSSLTVLVVGAFYGDSYVGDLVTDAFDGTATDTGASSITVPTTTNRQIAVLIQMDATNGVLEYKQSSEYSAAIAPVQAYTSNLIPAPDSGRYRVGYVFLKKGATALTYGDFWQVPEYLSKGSGAGYFPIAVDTDLTIGSNEQIVVSDFSITTGSLTVNGRIKIL